MVENIERPPDAAVLLAGNRTLSCWGLIVLEAERKGDLHRRTHIKVGGNAKFEGEQC